MLSSPDVISNGGTGRDHVTPSAPLLALTMYLLSMGVDLQQPPKRKHTGKLSTSPSPRRVLSRRTGRGHAGQPSPKASQPLAEAFPEAAGWDVLVLPTVPTLEQLQALRESHKPDTWIRTRQLTPLGVKQCH